MNRTLPPEALQEIGTRLEQAHKAFERRYPGDSGGRQPVHVVYGGAHLFRAGTTQKLGELALRSLDEYAPDFVSFAKAMGLADADRLPAAPEAAAAMAKSIESDADAVRRENRPAWFAHSVYKRVREKLLREPIEDFRIDFEDGYGNRPDDEEDGHAVAAAAELARAMSSGGLPPFIGIRLKPLTEELRTRSVRTLDIFLTELAAQTRGGIPAHFRVTLPKVTLPRRSSRARRSLLAARARPRSETGSAAARADDRNSSGALQRTRGGEPAAFGERRKRALHQCAFWTLRLHGIAQHRGLSSSSVAFCI